MASLSNLRLKILRHAVDQLNQLVERPLSPACGIAGQLGAVTAQEALIERHVRDFNMLALLNLELDASAYEICYALRRYLERPSRPAAELRIRDLVGMAICRETV